MQPQTKHGSIAQLVQSTCLTSRGSQVRILLLPQNRNLAIILQGFLFYLYIKSILILYKEGNVKFQLNENTRWYRKILSLIYLSLLIYILPTIISFHHKKVNRNWKNVNHKYKKIRYNLRKSISLFDSVLKSEQEDSYFLIQLDFYIDPLIFGKSSKKFGGYYNLLYFCNLFENGVVAQLVEQRTENPCVTGSNPVDATN